MAAVGAHARSSRRRLLRARDLSRRRPFMMDGVLFVESDPVGNDGVDAPVPGASRRFVKFRPWQQQEEPSAGPERDLAAFVVGRKSQLAKKRAISPFVEEVDSSSASARGA